MEPTPNNASAKIISALIIGLIVGFAAGAFWQERRFNMPREGSASLQAGEAGGGKEQTANAARGLFDTVRNEKKEVMTSGSEKTSAMKSAANGLKVEDQPAGTSVQIASVSTKEIIWLAVREEKDGKAGNILGAQKVPVGENQKVTVDLLRPTISGDTYRTIIYRDTGSSAFNYREDVLIEGVESAFKAQ